MSRFFEKLWYGNPAWSFLLAPVLVPASWLYRLGLAVHALSFRLGLRRVERVEGLQVVSVGNLVVGGSGKTPSVIALARWATKAGKKVCVLTRGYGRRSTHPVEFDSTQLPEVALVGDEPRLIARSCPGVTVIVNPDRVAAARRARELGCTVAILDDGFQHRRLHRDVDLVVLVKLNPERLLPWGPLREPVSSLRRATAVLNPNGARSHRLARICENGVALELGRLREQRVLVLCGIARPERLVESLREHGAIVVDVHAYADHHHFSPAQLESARSAASVANAIVVTTAKDAERIESSERLWVVDVEAELDVARLAPLLGWP